MPRNDVDSRTGTADVLDSTADDGEVRVKLGYLANGEGIDHGAAVWGPDGFLSRPNVPDATECSQALYMQSANRRYCLGFRDNRYAPLVGNLEPGDRMIVTDGEARIAVKQSDDMVNLYTVNQKTDASMMVALDGANGELNLMNGKAYIRLGEDPSGASCITLGISGGASISLYEDGTVQIDGANFAAECAQVKLGILAPPPPAPGLGIQYGPAPGSTSATCTVAA